MAQIRGREIYLRMSNTVMDLDIIDTLCFQLGGVRRRMTWRQFILASVLHTEQEMVEARFGGYWVGSDRLIPDKGDLRDYWTEILSDRDFLVPAPSYVLIRDPERKSGARLSGGYFIRRLAMHFGLVSDEGLERQQVAPAGVHKDDEAILAVEEVAKDILAPAPARAPPPEPLTMS
nr:hypothetical protein [Tanacetum cinerariifolium]